MRDGGRANRPGIAVLTTIFLVSCLLWLALPARAEARIFLIPSIGPPGTPVTVTGTGFKANEVVTLCWGDVRCSNSGRPVTNALGSFTALFSVPLDPEDYDAGANVVGACGRSTGECAQTVFTVITLSTTLPPTTLPPATTTTVPVEPTTTTMAPVEPTTTKVPATTTTAPAAPVITEPTTTTTPAGTTSTPPVAPGPTEPPPPLSSTIPAGSPDEPASDGSASASDPSDTTVEPEDASSEESDARTSAQSVTPTSYTPPEVLSRSLRPTEGVGEPGEIPAPSSQAGSIAAFEMFDDPNGPEGLSQTQWIILWVGTMVLFTIGVLIYEMRRRWRGGRG